MLSDEAAITNAALTIGFAEHRLPSLFSVAAAWMKRLQSEVEVGAILAALIDRVDLFDSGIRVSLKLPNSVTEEHARCDCHCADYYARLLDADQAARLRNASGYSG